MGDVTEFKRKPPEPPEVVLNQIVCAVCNFPQQTVWLGDIPDDEGGVTPVIYLQCSGCRNFDAVGVWVDVSDDVDN